VVHDDDIMLSCSGGEQFSLVLYLSQQVGEQGNQGMADLTRRLVDAFFALKRKYDPNLRFGNSLYSRYAHGA